jgi:protein O-mannosyl-transferase
VTVPVWHRLAFIAAFVALLVVGYGHTLGYSYHFDDFSSIRDNPVLRSPGDLGAIWGFRPSRVVVYLSLAWNLAIADSLVALRVVNVLIHAAASLLVGWIAAELWSLFAARSTVPPADAKARGRGRAARSAAPGRVGRGAPGATPGWDPVATQVGAVATLLFVAHPLATQAVTYLIQRTTSLAALLELAAIAAYLRARAGGAFGWWVASWAAALLAGLTKEMSVALPALVIAIEVALRGAGAPGRARAWQLAPFLILLPLVAMTASLHAMVLGGTPTGLRETDEVSRTTYLLTQLTVIPRYLELFVWPSGQTLDPDVPWIHRPEPAAMLGLAVLAGLVVLAFAVRRRLPLVALGVVWCLVALMPESSVIPIRDAMVEHRMYLPMVGLAWASAALLAAGAGLAANRGLMRGPWLPWAGLALSLVLAGATHARNRVWRDELTLWTDAALRAPLKARPHNNRGVALQELGRFAEAESAFRRTVAAEAGKNVSGLLNLGKLYGTSGRFTDALAVLIEAQRIEPRNLKVLNNLGSAWWALGDTAQAAAAYEQALLVEPGEPRVISNLARMRGGTPGSRP